jgi:chloramphenicol-sensitive protein RarD
MNDKKDYVTGLFFGASSFVMWGFLPLYWRMVDRISPYQIFAHRVFWSLIFTTLLLVSMKKIKEFSNLVKSGKNLKWVFLASIFISINWLTYIWAVNSGYIIEASLGYYINPLVLSLLGFIIFKERFGILELIGTAFAIIGVLIRTISYGQIPFISLILAFSFAIYGVLKKKSKLESIVGLGYETLLISIPSVIYILNIESKGMGIIGNENLLFFLLITLSGIATATPLIFYSKAAKLLPLSVMGFLQYISPTISLFIGIFVFKESFSFSSLISFGFIWIGLILFSYSQFKVLNTKRQA